MSEDDIVALGWLGQWLVELLQDRAALNALFPVQAGGQLSLQQRGKSVQMFPGFCLPCYTGTVRQVSTSGRPAGS